MLLWLCFVYKQIMSSKVSNSVHTVLQGPESLQVQTLVLSVELAVRLKRVRIVRGRIERSCDRVLLNRKKQTRINGRNSAYISTLQQNNASYCILKEAIIHSNYNTWYPCIQLQTLGMKFFIIKIPLHIAYLSMQFFIEHNFRTYP